MAKTTVEQSEVADTPLPPLTAALRRVGSDVTIEQRELLCLLLQDDLSGLAKRGVVMRALPLSDLSARLFEGDMDEPYTFAAAIYGVGTAGALECCGAIRNDAVVWRRDDLICLDSGAAA